MRPRPDQPYVNIEPYENENLLLQALSERVKSAAGAIGNPNAFSASHQFSTHLAVVGHLPKIMVMGALGRCGNGACDLVTRSGVPK